MLTFETKVETVPQVTPLRVKSASESLLVFTNQDIRKVNIKNGKLLNLNY